MSNAATRSGTDADEELSIVDCDLHVSLEDDEELLERLPEPFRSKGLFSPGGHYASPIGVSRDDSLPEDAPAGSRPELTREQVLDPLPVEYAIITGGTCLGLVAHPNRRYAAAVARAYNDWVLEKWCAFDDRIKASIGIAPHAPEAAVEEIHRLADHPDMVQVIIGSGTRTPLGAEEYWPIYEACAEEGLPLAMHIGPKGGQGIGNPNNPGGHESTYTEAHVGQVTNCYAQLASMVLEGVFEAFPDLTYVMVEGEFGWVPDLAWRMDRNYRHLGEEVSHLSKRPSDYVFENVKFTTQPIPEPPHEEYLHQLFEMIRAEETLMYCTDYPHWDGDYSPGAVFPRLDDATERAVFSGTARELYGL